MYIYGAKYNRHFECTYELRNPDGEKPRVFASGNFHEPSHWPYPPTGAGSRSGHLNLIGSSRFIYDEPRLIRTNRDLGFSGRGGNVGEICCSRSMVVTPAPINEHDSDSDTREVSHARQYAMVAKTAANENGVQCLDLWSAFMKYCDWDPTTPPLYSRTQPRNKKL